MYRKRRNGGVITFLLLFVSFGLVFFNRLTISDWFRLRGYSPSEAIKSLSNQATLTDLGEKFFYVGHPEITNRKTFQSKCGQKGTGERTSILGCYVSNGGLYGNIYLYDINDNRLEGVEQVTAAHEMLHVAYERLNTDDKNSLDYLLKEEYKKLSIDDSIKKTIAQYEAQDASSVPNELHSILGTEKRVLSAELENYYRKFFKDRQQVVSFYDRYESEFSTRQAQAEKYSQQITSLRTTIDANQQEIEQRFSVLRQQKQLLESNDEENNIAKYNALVNEYNTSVAEYNNLVNKTKALIQEHNRLVDIVNNIALEVETLVEAINSSPNTL